MLQRLPAPNCLEHPASNRGRFVFWSGFFSLFFKVMMQNDAGICISFATVLILAKVFK